MDVNQTPPAFLYDIPSLHQKNPAIPASLANVDLNRSIQAGDALDYEQVKHAKAIAQVLEAVQESEPLVTQEMVTSAKSRAVAVESAYSAAEYLPQNLFQLVNQMNQRIQNLEQHIQIGLAQTANLRIVSRHVRVQSLELLPLQKSVQGYGRATALPLTNVLDQPGQQTFAIQCPVDGVEPAIGSTPPNFSARIESYSHVDILRMIVFYNETFGIELQDDLPTRIRKFRGFLTEF